MNSTRVTTFSSLFGHSLQSALILHAQHSLCSHSMKNNVFCAGGLKITSQFTDRNYRSRIYSIYREQKQPQLIISHMTHPYKGKQCLMTLDRQLLFLEIHNKLFDVTH